MVRVNLPLFLNSKIINLHTRTLSISFQLYTIEITCTSCLLFVRLLCPIFVLRLINNSHTVHLHVIYTKWYCWFKNKFYIACYEKQKYRLIKDGSLYLLYLKPLTFCHCKMPPCPSRLCTVHPRLDNLQRQRPPVQSNKQNKVKSRMYKYNKLIPIAVFICLRTTHLDITG